MVDDYTLVQASYVLTDATSGYPTGTSYIDHMVLTLSIEQPSARQPSIIIEKDTHWETLAPDRLKLQILREDYLDVTTGEKLADMPPDPMLGIPIHLRKIEGQWEPEKPLAREFPSETLNRIDAYAYNLSRNYDQVAYGSAPRSPGETWTVTDPRIFFNEPADEVSGQATFTFDGVETVYGKIIARLRVDGAFQGRPLFSDGTWNRWKYQLDVRRSLDDGMDLETLSKFTVEMWRPGESLTDPPATSSRASSKVTREIVEK